MIDLHSHTTASDGQYSPSQLLELASQAGITQLAVTDHDTVAGLAEASRAAKVLAITLIPGIELSVFMNDREIHILGHFIDPQNARVAHFSSDAKAEREHRMEKMVGKLIELGIPIDLEQVQEVAGTAHLGRPHLARALVNHGICSSVKEAFDRFLGEGRPAYVERDRLGYGEAIELIHSAKGTATLAHPQSSRVTDEEIGVLRNGGLDGLEVFRSDLPPTARGKYLQLSRTLDLVPTAGSDFHGEKVTPDRYLGSVFMEANALDALLARANRS